MFSGLEACLRRAMTPFEPARLQVATFWINSGLLHVDLPACDAVVKPGASKANMSFLFDEGYYKVGKNGVSPFQNMHFHLCPIETRVGERRYDTGARTWAAVRSRPSATTRSPRTASSCSNTRGRRVRRECNAPSTLSRAGQGPRGQHREPEGRPGRGQRRLQKEPDQRVAVRPLQGRGSSASC